MTLDSPFTPAQHPRLIEEDRMFMKWGGSIPRLWFLSQRQATRIEAESLFGSAAYSVFYSRAGFTTLDDPTQDVDLGPSGYSRSFTTDVGVPAQTAARTVDFTREMTTALAEPDQEANPARPSGGTVNPIVHPITGGDVE